MNTDDQQDIVSGYYDTYKQTQSEIFAAECRRVRNSIFWIAGLLFGSDMLGLAIAKWIAEAHDGILTAESQLGNGSTFILRLPLISDLELSELDTKPIRSPINTSI